MQEYINKDVDAKRLLTQGDLDIRKISKSHGLLTADKYFSRVQQFVEKAPQYAEILASASNPSELQDIKEVLNRIGYDRLDSDFDGICDAITVGKQALAEKWAPEVVDKFNALYERIKRACAKKRFRTARPTDDEEQEEENPNSEVLLSEALEYFDYEEAHRKLRILAVDDIAVVLNTLSSVLSKHYEVFALTKASQVESFLLHTTPELFLLDIEMPEMSGYDLIGVIRQFDEHKDTPIMFLTGNASMENLKTAIALGACDFITKPINPTVLLEKIESKIVWKKAY